MSMRLFLPLASFGAAAGLHLDVSVHYPETNSAVDRCGFQFRIGTPFGDLESPPALAHVGADLFSAGVEVPDDRLYTQIPLAVMAEPDAAKIGSAECQAVCPRLGPQGLVVQNGAYARTAPLGPQNKVDLWPSFCLGTTAFVTKNYTFQSVTLGRAVRLDVRVPATLVENPMQRPGSQVPTIMFRFNSEWYWPDPEEEYTVWHDLMVQGVMEPVVVVEIYLDGIGWQEWENQPIFTEQALVKDCSQCSSELQFICDAWKGGYNGYVGGNHHYGQAADFYDELYEMGLPQLLAGLPATTDGSQELRVGAWGYCIGGLAAWNALTTRPGRFNVAYLGSPAMDFDCGAPFQSVGNLTWRGGGGGVRPKVYIDSGAAEGPLMNTQTLLLLRELQARGAVEGEDVFYERAEFGTHQGRGLLRRGLRGLLVLFGTGSAGATFYRPVLQTLGEANASQPPPGVPVPLELAAGAPPPAASQGLLVPLAASGWLVAAAAFVAGRRSAPSCVDGARGAGQQPLLA